MNVFQKVTLQSLRKNKTRTIVTIIGVLLSAAMICAVTTFVSSLFRYSLENAIYQTGNWHGSVSDTNPETIPWIQSHTDISTSAYAQHLGYAKLEDCINPNKPYLFLLSTSKTFPTILPVHLISGTYPTTSSELLLPEHLRTNGGVRLSLGDTLTLTLGDRILQDVSLGQDTPYYVYDENGDAIPNGETLQPKETRTYTVVGFYERPSFEKYTAPGYTALTVADGITPSPYPYTLWFQMKKPGETYDFMAEHQLSGTTNSSVLRSYGVTRYANLNSMLVNLVIIAILLILLGSVSLIYNAFSISVSERTKQFGLLSSIGATKKQLRHMVVTEALMVSAIGIPLGILVGIVGIAITLFFIGNKFQTLFSYPIPLKCSVSGLSVVIAVLLSLLTVLISAVIPSHRATKVTAMEAIRQSKEIRIQSRPIRTSKLTYLLFGLPGTLAIKYYKRSHKKYRATVLSLFLSVVLFISTASFTGALTESLGNSLGNARYDLLVYGFADEFETTSPEELLATLKAEESIHQIACAQNFPRLLSIPSEHLTSKFWEYYADFNDLSFEESGFAGVYTQMQFVDDAAFRDLLKKNNLREEDYFDSAAPKALLVDGIPFFEETEGKYAAFSVLRPETKTLSYTHPKPIDGYVFSGYVTDPQGNNLCIYQSLTSDQTLSLPEEDALIELPISLGNILDSGNVTVDTPYFLPANSRLVALYPLSLRDNVLLGQDPTSSAYHYYIKTDTHTETLHTIEETLNALFLDQLRTQDLVADQEENRNVVTILQVFAYGFIILISLIAAANVFHTISTNIALRRREFAMLKSVGMTTTGFYRMMNFECLLYGTRSLLFGLPVSVGISYLIHLAVSEGYQKTFHLPWSSITVAVVSVFLVVFVTMVYSMRKMRKDNPIDALKNENL